MDDDSGVITWGDVAAVCRLMGVRYKYEVEFNDFAVYRLDDSFGASFYTPQDALEYLTAEEHPIEKKYARILRTKP